MTDDASRKGLNDLIVYQLAEQGEFEVYQLVKAFPDDERYLSISQLKRSAASVANNIAESYHRRSLRDKVRILQDIAKGEAEETRQNLIRARRKGFVPSDRIDPVIELYTNLLCALSGYIRFIRRGFRVVTKDLER